MIKSLIFIGERSPYRGFDYGLYLGDAVIKHIFCDVFKVGRFVVNYKPRNAANEL